MKVVSLSALRCNRSRDLNGVCNLLVEGEFPELATVNEEHANTWNNAAKEKICTDVDGIAMTPGQRDGCDDGRHAGLTSSVL